MCQALSEREKTVLRAASLSPREGEFVTICKLYLPEISDDDARALRRLIAENPGRL